MFEVGFTELVLICGLALIVLGPQRLPKVASQLGRWMGRARAMARQLREQLDQEVNFEESRSRTYAPATPPPPMQPETPVAPAAEPSPDQQTQHERPGP